jgi:phosphopantothenate---cysteine ligase (ATP)
MYRDRSLEPFSRHFTGQKFLDMLELHENGNTTINVSSDSVDVLAPILTKYKEARHYLLSVPFNTVADYMWLIRAACEFLQQFEKRAIFYSGAAVSDFYVPAEQMPTHKMQSNEVPTIHLAKVPKMIVPLVSLWIPKAYVVTFKLETDESLLLPKSRHSLERYNHQVRRARAKLRCFK